MIFNIKDNKMDKFVSFSSLEDEICNFKICRGKYVILRFLMGIREIPPFFSMFAGGLASFVYVIDQTAFISFSFSFSFSWFILLFRDPLYDYDL